MLDQSQKNKGDLMRFDISSKHIQVQGNRIEAIFQYLKSHCIRLDT